MYKTVAGMVLAFSLSGCARNIVVPTWMAAPEGTCHLPVVKLTANQFDDADRSLDTRRQIGTLGDGFKSSTPGKSREQGKSVLVLSGGSLHGAFGAGLFYGWINSPLAGDDAPPTYDIITGVSTGALQSTFIFLATSQSKDIQDGAAAIIDNVDNSSFLKKRIGVTTNGVRGPETSYAATLAQDYMPDRESDLLHLRAFQRFSPNKLGFLELIGNNSLATMAPLRKIVNAELSDKALQGVAAEARAGRRLYVAMADLANEYGYAADLTKLADLAVLAGHPELQASADVDDLKRVFPGYDPQAARDPQVGAAYLGKARNCYTDALLASSSVPPGVDAVPIEIIKEGKDRHILDPDHSSHIAARHGFIDGGAAFAVFFSQLRYEINGLDKVDMDLVVNGTYYPQDWSKWIGPKNKTKKIENVRLSSLDYGLQATEILQGQVRVFSVQEARRWELGRGRLRWAFIDNDMIEPGADGLDKLTHWNGAYKEEPIAWKYPDRDGDRDCQYWHDEDDKKVHPMEFYPSYMRCVLNYGVMRGQNPKYRWNMIWR